MGLTYLDDLPPNTPHFLTFLCLQHIQLLLVPPPGSALPSKEGRLMCSPHHPPTTTALVLPSATDRSLSLQKPDYPLVSPPLPNWGLGGGRDPSVPFMLYLQLPAQGPTLSSRPTVMSSLHPGNFPHPHSSPPPQGHSSLFFTTSLSTCNRSLVPSIISPSWVSGLGTQQ